MNRIVKQDYERLVEYFSLYNLKEVCTDTAFLEQLKTLHRKLYAYLLFLREAEDTNYYSNIIIFLDLTYDDSNHFVAGTFVPV